MVSWWLTMVELVVEEPMVALFGGWNGGEREEERRLVAEKKKGRRLVFCEIWTPISYPSNHQWGFYL